MKASEARKLQGIDDVFKKNNYNIKELYDHVISKIEEAVLNSDRRIIGVPTGLPDPELIYAMHKLQIDGYGVSYYYVEDRNCHMFYVSW